MALTLNHYFDKTFQDVTLMYLYAVSVCFSSRSAVMNLSIKIEVVLKHEEMTSVGLVICFDELQSNTSMITQYTSEKLNSNSGKKKKIKACYHNSLVSSEQ